MRARIEQLFGGLARLLYRRRALALILMLMATGALVSQLPRLEVDTSTEGFLHDELEQDVPHLDEITSLVNARNTRGDEFEAGGAEELPFLTDAIKRAMLKDMRRFMAMAIGTIALFLFLMFRRVSGVVMPLLVVILSLVSTLAVMAISGTPIKLATQILPSFLLAVGVGSSVHILAIFYRHLQRRDDKEEAIVQAMSRSGLAVLMTSLTTAAGLASFSTAEIAPIAELGVFRALGVMLALVYTILFLPVLIAVFPVGGRTHAAAERPGSWMHALLTAIAHISTGHARVIVAGAAS
jgi:predicted RND superfamily exporter protein